MRKHVTRVLSVAMILFAIGSGTQLTYADSNRPYRVAQADSSSQLTAREAAAKARAQYGGKVLKVTKAGKAYKVRLLQDSGKVITVMIRG